MKKNVITKTLALLGTIAVCFPLLAPVLLTVIFAIRTGLFRFDFLMPAELFPLVLAGGGLLLWAALRARVRLAWIGWALGAAVALLFGGQGLAIVTGLASGERAPEGIWFILAVSAIAGYTLAVLALAVGGILLLGDLSKHTDKENSPSI
jgi:hypothetical protein